MRKRIIAIAVTFAMVAGCTACGNKADSVNTDKTKKTIASANVKQSTTEETTSDEATSDEMTSEEITTTEEGVSDTAVSEAETTEVRATDAASGTPQKTNSTNTADSSVNTPKTEKPASATTSTKSGNTSKGNSSVNTATSKTTASTKSNKADNSTNAATKPATVNINTKPAETQPTTVKQSETTKAPAPVHTHNYTSTITTQATCNTAGIKTYRCSCGDTYTESIPATDSHNWEHHDAEYATVVVKEAWDETIITTAIICNQCNKQFTKEEYGSIEAAVEAHAIHTFTDGFGTCENYTLKDIIINTIHHDAVTEQQKVSDAYDICVTCGTKR